MKTNLIAAAAGSALVLSACVANLLNIPQTRDEFIRHPQVKKTTYTVPRPLDAVVSSLVKAKRCTDDESVETRSGVGMLSSSRDMRYMTVDKNSRDRAEMVYRWASNNMAGQPKGGYLLLMGDLESQGVKGTKVTLYHSDGRDSQIGALKQWSRGDDQGCHGWESK